MAVWYELKYPDNKIYNLFENANLKLDTSFFNSNNEIDNTNKFINGRLMYNERNFMKKIKYPSLVSINKYSHSYFELTNNGIIKNGEGFNSYSKKDGYIKDYSKIFEGIHIANAKFVAEIEGYQLNDPENDIEKIINHYKNNKKLKELVLDAIMYKIIKRGDIRIGPNRGLLFAKEFGRNIDIPMMYGIDSSDANGKNLIKVYLNNGGNRNLKIFINFFYDGIGSILFDRMTINEYIKKYYSDDLDFYTKEELKTLRQNLGEKMINILNKRANMLSLKKRTEK